MRLIGAAATLAVVALLAGGGCGGSKSSSPPATETTTESMTVGTETTSTETTATESTETTATESTDTTATEPTGTTSSGAIGLTGKCKDLAGLAAEFSTALGATSASGSPDFEKTAQTFSAFADKVPEEIRGDFKVLADAFAKFAVLYKDIKVEPGKTPDAATLAKLAEAGAVFNDAKIKAASDHLTAWQTKNCGTTP